MKRKLISHLLIAVTALFVAACSGEETQAQTTTTDMEMNITIGGKTLVVNLVDNAATRTLLAALQESPITYEAEGDGYNYEQGVYATIPFHWNDRAQTLTIGQRQGEYPGMLQSRRFLAVLPSTTLFAP